MKRISVSQISEKVHITVHTQKNDSRLSYVGHRGVSDPVWDALIRWKIIQDDTYTLDFPSKRWQPLDGNDGYEHMRDEEEGL